MFVRNLKQCNKNILSCVEFIYFVCIFFGLFHISSCLYEDQIGKFDWRQTYVGQVKFAEFDTVSLGKKIFVATEENVIAALNVKSGHILWRQVLEKDERGLIWFMSASADAVTTVSGSNPLLVRGWDLNRGFLLWEWTFPRQTQTDKLHDVKWFQSDGKLLNISTSVASLVEVTIYNVTSGSKIQTEKIALPWKTKDSECVLVTPYLACLESNAEGSTLHSMLLTGMGGQTHSKVLSGLGKATLEPILGPHPTVAVAFHGTSIKELLTLTDSGPKLLPYHVPANAKLLQIPTEDSVILMQLLYKDEFLEITAMSLDSGEPLSDVAEKVQYRHNASSLGRAELATAMCVRRKDKGMRCRVLLVTEDHAIVMLHHLHQADQPVVWIREEALASIAAVEMLDLPVSDTYAAIGKEFNHKETGFLGMFAHRLESQVLQLKSLLLKVLGLGEPPSAGQRAGLVRDEFGLHKMIVVATAVGKIFGIDNLSGEILWRQRLQNVAAYQGQGTNRNHMVLYVQRTTRHFPHRAQCALLTRHKVTGEGVLFTFYPISGELTNSLHLGYRVKQTSLLHQPDEDFLRGILLLDEHGNLHVHPESARVVAAQLAGSTFIFTAEPKTGALVGFSLAFTTQQNLVASRIWEVHLGQRITAIVGKSPVERVHSQGRVLGDRSVLYKYVNPNLVAVLTQDSDPVHKDVLNIFLVDVVSGSVVFSVSHKRACNPVHIVHSENWLLYSYFSDKFRRTEIVTLELYEGKVQSNTTAFSSVASPIQPIVDQQAYILPGNIEAMRETITEKGITSKHLLVALATGGVLELPWVFVDPRRPISVTPEMREEGVIPYMPELPISSESIINYNQTVQKVKGIHTSPSGLESTCLVLVYGLDLFYTRVAPSKTFDVLKEDFDHFLIMAVLLGLTLASYITRKLASRKALKQAWK